MYSISDIWSFQSFLQGCYCTLLTHCLGGFQVVIVSLLYIPYCWDIRCHVYLKLLYLWLILLKGSGQQSVTGVEASDDANSYWRIRGKTDGICQRGAPVKCGQAVRLTHVNTGKNLHTHHFPSPLSNNQVKPEFFLHTLLLFISCLC